jgi:hypothetical protein
MSKQTPEQKAHAERVKKELAEQKEIFARVKADSDRYDEAVGQVREEEVSPAVEDEQSVLDLGGEEQGE